MKYETKNREAHRTLRQTQTEKIAAGYQRRLENQQDPKFKTPTNSAAGYLRRKIYRQAAEPEPSGRPEKVTGRTGCRPDPRLFPLLLAAVFDCLGKTGKSDRDRLRLTAHELEFAAENRVPPKYLIGFIQQNGGSKGIEKLRAAKRGLRESSVKSSRGGVGSASEAGTTRSRKRQKTSRSKAGNSTRRRRNRPGQDLPRRR